MRGASVDGVRSVREGLVANETQKVTTYQIIDMVKTLILTLIRGVTSFALSFKRFWLL